MRPANQPRITVGGALKRKRENKVWAPWPKMMSAIYKVLERQLVLQMELRSYSIIKRQVRPGLTNAGTFLVRKENLNDHSVGFVTFCYSKHSSQKCSE